MSSNSYMTLNAGGQQQLADLQTVVSPLVSTAVDTKLSTGVSGLKLSGALTLSGTTAGAAGGIRLHDSSSPYIEYTVDGGTTWTKLASSAQEWSSTTAYAAGSIVSYSGAWYACATAHTGHTPGADGYWRLLSDGSVSWHVSSREQLQAALASSGTSVEVCVHGQITGTVSATVQSSCVTIRSDESCSFSSASLTLAIPSSGNVYWHCCGTKLTASSVQITATGGTLWIERLVSGGTVQLSSCIMYQQITGTVTGNGTQQIWTIPSAASDYVPRDLSSLSTQSYSSDGLVYMYRSSSANGSIAVSSLVSQAAASAVVQMKINAQGTLASRPATASEGYIYYATDNGNVYRMGASNVWDAGVHIQGPTGATGAAGTDGTDGVSPAVTMTTITGGTRVTITDRTHSQGQSFDVMNGTDGSVPSFAAGNVTTLAAGQPATVTLSQVSGVNVFSFGIPKGADGQGVFTGTAPITVSDTDISITGYPYMSITTGGATQSLVPGSAYDLSTIAITTLSLTLPSEYGSCFGECWMAVLFGSSATVTLGTGVRVIDTPFPGEVNLLHIYIWNGEIRVHVADHWKTSGNVRKGSLQVVYPDDATAPTGSGWSLTAAAPWHDFGDIVPVTLSNTAPTITFNAVSGKTTPASIATGLLQDKLVRVVSGLYT